MTTTFEHLSPAETEQLTALEGRIRRGWASFLDVGEALLEIRDARLYRATDATFDAYCERVWGWTPQRAGQLIHGARTATTIETIGFHVENERQAREWKQAAAVIRDVPPEDVPVLAQAIRAVTGSSKPSTSEVRAFAETVLDLHNVGVVEHPDTGEQVPWTELPDAARLAVLRENVTNNTYERLQRQKTHIEASKESASRPNVIDWLDDYGANNLGEFQFIEITRNRAGYTAKLVDESSGAVLAEAEGNYFKRAVLALIEKVGTTKGSEA